jgi:hypothetical protein
MAGLGRTRLALRFFGEDLDPQVVGQVLGADATAAAVKGETRTDGWRLRIADRAPGDLEGQLRELFASLTPDLDAWRTLSARYGGNVFCGLFMDGGNEGMSFTPATLAMLADRGLRLDLDIYDAPER